MNSAINNNGVSGYSANSVHRFRNEQIPRFCIFLLYHFIQQFKRNMSLGIALLRALAKKAASVLGKSFDIEIVEAHHNRKADSPSGTALMLLDAVKQGCESPREAVFGRHGRDCKRQKQEIGVHALRGGTVTGEHEVCFFGNSERVKISHSAENRSVFAAGALQAAMFLVGKEPGLYNMDDVVGQI